MPTFIGLDLAWKPNRESGVCRLEGDAHGALRCVSLETRVLQIEWFVGELTGLQDRLVLAIDAPLVATPLRKCDALIGKHFGRHKVYAYTAKPRWLRKCGFTAGLDLACALKSAGFSVDPVPFLDGEAEQPVALEVYPHTLHIRYFQLEQRLAYKRGRIAHRKLALRRYQEHLRQFLEREAPGVLRSAELTAVLSAEELRRARGASLKRLEDKLDAIICALSAWRMWCERKRGWTVLGDVQNGYIMVPRPRSWRLPGGPSPLVRSGGGTLSDLGASVRELGLQRSLVTSDLGIVAAGITRRAVESLEEAGLFARVFSDFGENPSESDVAAAAEAARAMDADSLVGVGGGSSLDVAKGAAFLLAGGGRMEDYRGYGKCPRPLLPLIGVPTTAGTGSEAQSYALISRDRDQQKLACGAPSAMFRAVILDPTLLRSAPPEVIAATGFDAIAHAVETAVTCGRTEASVALSHRAFMLLSRAFPLAVTGQADAGNWEDMQLGAFLAGAAIERSMLGAAHACANPLTRRFDVAHGRALAITLPRVVRWNAASAREAYRDLLRAAEIPPGAEPAETLAGRLDAWIATAGLPRDLGGESLPVADLPALAEEASAEWTGRFNPRPFDAAGALAVYRSAVA